MPTHVHVTISTPGFTDHRWPPIDTQWYNITHLSINSINFEISLQVLRRAPMLESYNFVSGFEAYSRMIHKPVAHRNLHKVMINASKEVDGTTFLDLIRLPGPKSLEWTFSLRKAGLESLLSFIERSSCSLVNLAIASLGSHEEDLVALMREASSLQLLYLLPFAETKGPEHSEEILLRSLGKADSDDPEDKLLPDLKQLIISAPLVQSCEFAWNDICKLFAPRRFA